MKKILLSSAAALALLTSLAFVAGAKADTVSIDTFVAGNSEPWVQATGNQPFGFYSAAYPGDHYEMFGSVAPDVIVLQAGITSLSMTYTGGAVIGGGVTVESSSAASSGGDGFSQNISCKTTLNCTDSASVYANTNEYAWGLMASFADSTGKVISGTTEMTGNTFNVTTIPTGAYEMLLGINSYSYNGLSGGYSENVTENYTPTDVSGGNLGGVSGGVPETSTYLMALIGILGMGGLSMRKRAAA